MGVLTPADGICFGIGLLPGAALAYFSGWKSTMYILGMKRQQRVTVALSTTHMHKLEIWIWNEKKKKWKLFSVRKHWFENHLT